jgi:hypothetical protein
MTLVSLSEASRQTGVSRTQFYRLRNRGALKGWLKPGPGRGDLIELEGLREHCLGCTRMRVDSVHTRPAPAPTAAPEVPLEWVADWANGQLAIDSWGPPPWNATRWATLLNVFELAEVLAAKHGPLTHELEATVLNAGEADDGDS